MRSKRIILLAAVALSLIGLMSSVVLSQSSNLLVTQNKQATIEEIVGAGNKSVIEGDWVKAEVNFREAIRLEPQQPLWRIQLLIALGQQRKWKEAFKEMETVIHKLDAADWVLSINQKMPDGQVAFVNTETFRDEKDGILRYVKAVKENKKVDSVAQDIGAKLDDFAKQRKFALIYDISKFKDKPFESGKTIDATKDFIAYYNERRKD